MNKLIYGKDTTQGIVGIEVIDDGAEVFIQDNTGEVSSQIVSNKFWIMTNEHLPGYTKIGGDLHYKYIKFFNKAFLMYNEKRKLKESGVDFFSIGDEKESLMVMDGYTYFKGLKPKEISVLSFDIETTGIEHNADAKVLIISNTFRKNGSQVKKMFCYDQYENQGELIKAWIEWVNEVDPSIMMGHNIYSYDLPYLRYIANQYSMELNLGRNGSPIKFFNYESKKRIDGSRDQAYHKVRCYGRELIDTMFLAINYDVATKKYESYALKKIIAQEKLEKPGRVFYDAGQIRYNYTNPDEWEKIKAYCADDSDDALALFDLMVPAFFYVTQAVPKSFQAMIESASGSQINSMMVRSYLQDGHSLPKATEVQSFQGAISFGNPGIYRNAFKVDVASLYPSIMIQYKVYDKVKDPKGNMLAMVETFTNERLKNKKLAEETGDKYYDDLQNSQKIVINSMYGFMGAAGLIFNSPENAAFVTAKGREVLQRALEWAESKKYQIVNADTDSITFTDNSRELTAEDRKAMLAELNSLYPERIKFADDGYFFTFIILAAKNYIMHGPNKKTGVVETKLKGSGLKDAKKEKALKEFQQKVIKALIDGTNSYQDIYHQYVKEASNINDINRWASKKTISAKVLTSERSNESKIRDAIVETEYREGDKVYMYFRPDQSLGLAEKFDGEYDKIKMYEKLFKTSQIFDVVIPQENFPNYKLKKNQKKLEEILNGQQT